jgi:ELWxxDGT repeat protein
VPTTGRELYFSQGSAASTQLALDLEPGPDSVDARALTAFGDGVLLAVRRATGHGELWRLERPGATPTRLARFEPGLRVTNLRVVGAQAYFIVGPDAPELWRTDGSVEGTVRLAAVPGNARLETVGNVLYFDAADDAAGVELRRWLPTASAPELVIDGSPGPASSRLDAFVASDGGVYFDLVEASAGSALWFAAADTSGPRVAARLEGTLGAQGFYTSPVQLRFEVSDPDSAVYALEGCDAGTVESDTPTALTFSCAASSLGGTTRTSVTVKRDATAPQLGCPTRVAVPAGTPLALELSAQDAVDPSPTLVVAPALGTVLPSGTTLVDVVATDAAGNRSTCTVRVDVTGAAAPPGVSARCGCQSGEGAGLSLLACALGRWVRRRALRAPTTPA